MSTDGNGAPTRVEQFSQLVRALVTVGLTAGFIWGFVVSGSIGGDIFVTVFATVIGYWFATREQRSRSSDATSRVPRLPAKRTERRK